MRVCECGQILYSDSFTRTHKSHLKSAYHRNHRRIQTLLVNPCITFQEIGHRLNISRERVRQISSTLDLNRGHTRQKVCTLSSRIVMRGKTIEQLGKKHPRNVLPISGTLFANRIVNIGEAGYAVSKKHDYYKYKEAWHLLNGNK